MKCPFCDHPDTKVIDSRPTEEGHAIRRRRGCDNCGRRFTTYEWRKWLMKSKRTSAVLWKKK